MDGKKIALYTPVFDNMTEMFNDWKRSDTLRSIISE